MYCKHAVVTPSYIISKLQNQRAVCMIELLSQAAQSNISIGCLSPVRWSILDPAHFYILLAWTAATAYRYFNIY